MSMDSSWLYLAAAGAGLACSFLNTVASAGSAVSLPILMLLGLDPVTANATNRVPVLVGAVSASASFGRSRAMPWALALRICIPVTLGGGIGAYAAEQVPGRDLGLVITAAVLIALVLLFTKLKKAIMSAVVKPVSFRPVHWLLFFLIGAWLGFLVLDGATYLLLALVLVVGLPLEQANAVKSAALVPTTAVALVLFMIRGVLDWPVAAAMGVGSVAGGLVGARLAANPRTRRIVFPLLVAVVLSEVVHLGIHYFAQTW